MLAAAYPARHAWAAAAEIPTPAARRISAVSCSMRRSIPASGRGVVNSRLRRVHRRSAAVRATIRLLATGYLKTDGTQHFRKQQILFETGTAPPVVDEFALQRSRRQIHRHGQQVIEVFERNSRHMSGREYAQGGYLGSKRPGVVNAARTTVQIDDASQAPVIRWGRSHYRRAMTRERR